MSTLCHPQPIPFSERKKYEGLKKCGEITSSEDGLLIGLNCVFCEAIFLRLETFVPHMLELHKAELVSLYRANSSENNSAQVKHLSLLDEGLPTVDGFVEIKLETDSEISNTKKANNVEVTINDPLEVPLNVNNDGVDVKNEADDSIDVVAVAVKETSDIMEVVASESYTDEESVISDKDDCNASETPTPKICTEKLSEIATIYKQYPCLWDLDLEENRDKNRRNEAEKQMLQQVSQELKTQFTSTEVKKRLSILRRIYAREKKRRLEAEESNKPFKPKNQLYTTLQFLEHSIGPFKCKECSEVIPSHDKFRVHQAAHAGVMPFVCKICGKGMNYLGNLQTHMRRHTGAAQVLCSYCGKGLPSVYDLNLHMNIHADACNYVCDICGKAFSRPVFLKQHKLKHDPENKAYKCGVCSKAFFQHYKYQEHMNSHLNIRSCVCQVCGKGFFSKKTLYQHIKTHADKKAYTCTICRKDYARPASYYSHMKAQHSLEKKDLATV